MFESLKIISECKRILKKHNIKYNEDFRIYKKLGLIHCQVDDWRGPVEVDGFPVFTIKSATLLLIESCAFDHYLLEEKNKREHLMKEYPYGYGEYETRKYLFENIIKVIKGYDEKHYVSLINKYTKYLNMNSKTKQKWSFNKESEKFEISPLASYSAVIINKARSIVRIYNQDPCGGRLDDNIYKLISENIEDGLFKFSFTNNGEDRFYLEIYNPKYADGSDNYIMIHKADKVVWSYMPFENSESNRQKRIFVFDGAKVNIVGEIKLK